MTSGCRIALVVLAVNLLVVPHLIFNLFSLLLGHATKLDSCNRKKKDGGEFRILADVSRVVGFN